MTQFPQDNSIDLICPECGYDLRGLTSERCPECGTAFDPVTAVRSHIPWVQRQAIGSFRAYWRTVWLSTAQIKQLSVEVARPVSLKQAQRFRVITWAASSLVPVGLVLIALRVNGGIGRELSSLLPGPGSPLFLPAAPDFTLPWMAGILLWPTMIGGILLFLYLISGVGSYWFHPGNIPYRQQNRAVGLSHYACAPLVFISFALLLVVGLAFVADINGLSKLKQTIVLALVGIAFYGVGISSIFIFWLNTLRLLSRTVGASGMRMTCAAIGLPISWLISAGVAFGALPWVVGYIFLMIDSVRH